MSSEIDEERREREKDDGEEEEEEEWISRETLQRAHLSVVNGVCHPPSINQNSSLFARRASLVLSSTFRLLFSPSFFFFFLFFLLLVSQIPSTSFALDQIKLALILPPPPHPLRSFFFFFSSFPLIFFFSVASFTFSSFSSALRKTHSHSRVSSSCCAPPSTFPTHNPPTGNATTILFHSHLGWETSRIAKTSPNVHPTHPF